MTFSKRVPLVIAVIFALDAIVVALCLLDRAIGRSSRGLSQFFDLNREGNLPTWYSSIQWFAVAALLGGFAAWLLRRSQAGGRPMLALAILFLCLSLDEVAEIHERLGLRSDWLLEGGTRVNGPFPFTGIWMFVIGIPMLLLFAASIRAAAAPLRAAPGALSRIVLGLGSTAVGAMVVDLMSNLAYAKRGSMYAPVEESLELVGATLVLWGSYELLRGHGLRFGVHGVESVVEEVDTRRAADRSAA